MLNLIKETSYSPYTGQALEEAKFVNGKLLDAYFPPDGLVDVVELARLLQRPILLRGEPGCGKTSLAEAIAYELYGDEYSEFFHSWYIKSTTKARDGLYTFDYIARLRDANAGDPNAGKEFKKDYCELGPLGEAISKSTAEKPHIVLIDEIDKADIDFPNDLLLELDKKQFNIPETGEKYPKNTVTYPPIIIITSNDEKQLSSAFLRRCLFFYIKFPDTNKLEKIIEAKLNAEINKTLPTTLIKAIAKRFESLYKEMSSNNTNLGFTLSTSSLLDWVKALAYGLWDKKNIDEATLMENLEQGRNLPYPYVMFKTYEALESEAVRKQFII